MDGLDFAPVLDGAPFLLTGLLLSLWLMAALGRRSGGWDGAGAA